MAEIKIERKKMLWPWILAGFGIAAVLAIYFFYYRDKESINVSTKNEGGKIHESIVEYTSYVDSDTTAMGLDHKYTHNAILKLANAIRDLASLTGYSAKNDIQQAIDCANLITIDPNAGTHADNIKKAAAFLSTALANIQKKGFTGLRNEADQVRKAGEEIDTDVLTLDQKRKVRAFFTNASILLKKMDQIENEH
ncbi:hypothetical protein [Pedobacter endophyticus]|uniref:Uncharacterized protein n=1 Tax=Pedobacter endophyticus TaxID=2789740 RepID=A0A7U3SPK5_9SPHI|nr:hypothetical protein [Pedobacter endophyticus]QPH38603.1 hypothetical protein IZT61_16160 [Pedobacter endophyticus]